MEIAILFSNSLFQINSTGAHLFIEEKNKAINIINEEVQITYECYECEEDDAGKV